MGGGGDPINGGDWVTDGRARSTRSRSTASTRASSRSRPRGTARHERRLRRVQEACDCSVPGLPLNAVPVRLRPAEPAEAYAQRHQRLHEAVLREGLPHDPRDSSSRELLGTQGVVSSLCPIHTRRPGRRDDPLFGYRPALAIVSRLKNALSTQCLPQQLGRHQRQCAMPRPGDPCGHAREPRQEPEHGLQQPQAGSERRHVGNGPGHPQDLPDEPARRLFRPAELVPRDRPLDVRDLPRQSDPLHPNGSCATNGTGTEGWCYVTDTKFTGQCTQAVQFTRARRPTARS